MQAAPASDTMQSVLWELHLLHREAVGRICFPMRVRDSRRFGRWFLPFACLGLTGCFSLDSAVFLNRGYTRDDLVREEALEGRWAREPDVDAARIADEPPEPALSIEQADVTQPCYKVTFHEGFVSDMLIAKPATSAKLCTFRISGQTFIDVTRWPEGINVEAMTVTWHWFGAVDVSSDELRLKLLHPLLVAAYLSDHPLDLPSVTLENGDEKQIVVTARPQEIQMFLLLHLGHGDLMDEEYVLKKLPPPEPPAAGDDAQS
jgi:hypothetical protein